MKFWTLQDEVEIGSREILNRQEACGAKIKAFEMIEEGCIEQYIHFRNYGQELLRSNQ